METDRGLGQPALAGAQRPGYALAFAVVFGGVALAAYHSGFTRNRGGRLWPRSRFFSSAASRDPFPEAQRLIDPLHPPEPDAPAKPDEIPGWAVAVYALIGLALVVAIIALEDTYTYAAMGLFVAWAVGRNLLELFWRKRDGTTDSGRRSIAFDERLDAWPRSTLGGACACSAPRRASAAVRRRGAARLGIRPGPRGRAEVRRHMSAMPGIAYIAAAACGVAAILSSQAIRHADRRRAACGHRPRGNTFGPSLLRAR